MDKGFALGELVRVLDNMPTSSFRGAVLQVRGFHRGAVVGVVVQHSPVTFGVKWLCLWPKFLVKVAHFDNIFSTSYQCNPRVE